MRVGLIYDRWLPDKGGLESYLAGLTAALAEGGHELHVVAQEAGGSAVGLPVEWHWVGRKSGLVPAALRVGHFARVAAREVGRLPVDVSVGFGRTYRQDVHRAGGGCHAVYSRLLPLAKRLRWKNRVELAIERRLYCGGGTGLFVVNSEKVAGELGREYGLGRERVRVVRTAVDLDRYRAAGGIEVRRAMRDGLGLPTWDGRPAFLYAGREHRRKGLDLLLARWAGIDAQLWVAGPRLGGKLRAMAAVPGVAGKVFELGDGDLAGAFRAADWFLHPTRYDACANTVLQAMASGLPGLISARDGASELVEDGVSGWVLGDPEDGEELLRMLAHACGVSVLEREEMGLRARAAVGGLTWERHVAQWEDVLGEAMAVRLGRREAPGDISY
jgi:UDP-glucose:(heptosyl)LPS alpha-1,3-glucosyltransferase